METNFKINIDQLEIEETIEDVGSEVEVIESETREKDKETKDS